MQRSEWYCPWRVLSRVRGPGHEHGTNQQRPTPGGRGCTGFPSSCRPAGSTSSGSSQHTRRLPSHLVASSSLDGSHLTWRLYDHKYTSFRDVFLINFYNSSITYRLKSARIRNTQLDEFPCNHHPIRKQDTNSTSEAPSLPPLPPPHRQSRHRRHWFCT